MLIISPMALLWAGAPRLRDPTHPMPNSAHQPGRLDLAQVERYRSEGYLVFGEPVLPEAKFAALKSYFRNPAGGTPGGRAARVDGRAALHASRSSWSGLSIPRSLPSSSPSWAATSRSSRPTSSASPRVTENACPGTRTAPIGRARSSPWRSAPSGWRSTRRHGSTAA
jgi:hypothetical protein